MFVIKYVPVKLVVSDLNVRHSTTKKYNNVIRRLLLLARLIGQYCFARCCLWASVVCRRRHL